jgi:hypothetical protein
MSGGLGIALTTDAVSATNGGTITTAGGVAIAKKLFVGTDLANEEEQYKFVFDPISENVYFKAKMKYGVQIAFPDEVVYFTL